jgi:hypothetical protein
VSMVAMVAAGISWSLAGVSRQFIFRRLEPTFRLLANMPPLPEAGLHWLR